MQENLKVLMNRVMILFVDVGLVDLAKEAQNYFFNIFITFWLFSSFKLICFWLITRIWSSSTYLYSIEDLSWSYLSRLSISTIKLTSYLKNEYSDILLSSVSRTFGSTTKSFLLMIFFWTSNLNFISMFPLYKIWSSTSFSPSSDLRSFHNFSIIFS